MPYPVAAFHKTKGGSPQYLDTYSVTFSMSVCVCFYTHKYNYRYLYASTWNCKKTCYKMGILKRS